MQTFVADVAGEDPALPEVSLRIGGEERHLCFDLNAIILAEKASGVPLLRAVVSDVTATELRGLLWAACLRENPKLTIDEVGSWITPGNAPVVHQALLATWFGSVTEDAADAAKGEGEGQTAPAV